LKGRSVLVVGPGSTRVAAAAPALERRDLQVQRAASSESALQLARKLRFDLALFDYPDPGLSVQGLLHGLADAGPPDHRIHVVLVATPDRIEEARAHVGNGVAGVLSTARPTEESVQLIYDILGAPPRVAMRKAVRLEVRLEEGTSLVFRQTQDLSATGMLVSTPHEQPVGTEASFRLDLSGARGPIEGKAQVVRHILEESTGSVRAVGMRFVSFKGDDGARLKAFVDSSLPAKA
jgi:CheY-like chemotaxis protein